MAKGGIICKVWNIKGTTASKGAAAQLGDSIGYILNDEKTDCTLEMAGSNINNPGAQLERECKYVENDVKTVSGAYVGCVNLMSADIKDAVAEMLSVKEFYGKTDGRAALHGVISLPESESGRENAEKLMKLCESVLKEIFPNNQAIFAVHTNTENLHVHFIVNSVGLDGKKIHQDKNFVRKVLQPCINKYAEIYGLTPNTRWTDKKANDTRTFPQIKMDLREKIDLAIEKSENFTDFIRELQNEGLTVNVGKYISLKDDAMGKPVRTHNLGSNYTKEMIVERIATRRQDFVRHQVNDYTMKDEPPIFYKPTITHMKKYKDMNPEQKAYVLQQLRLGRNPWREHQQLNWQLNNIAEQLNERARIYAYVDYYSTDGSLQGALDGIIAAKKKIGEEKRIIAEQKRKYKPILDIYEEMKPLQRKAYLYEHENVSEYRSEFEQYRRLTRRLRDGYNKDIREVANFVEECDERLLYAHAQLQELSTEYRELKHYADRNGERIHTTGRLMDAVGLYENLENEKMHVYRSESFFVASNESDVMMRVVKTPGHDSRGRIVEQYFLTMIDKNGEIIERIDSVDTNGKKEFSQRLAELEEKYNMKGCERFSTVSLAREYMDTGNEKNEEMEPRANLAQTSRTKTRTHTLASFTQSVNRCYRTGSCTIIDTSSRAFYAKSRLDDEEVVIEIYDSRKNLQESIRIPAVSDRTDDGYRRMVDIQKKYGFSDSLLTFETDEDAENYMRNEETERNANENRNREGWRL